MKREINNFCSVFKLRIEIKKKKNSEWKVYITLLLNKTYGLVYIFPKVLPRPKEDEEPSQAQMRNWAKKMEPKGIHKS